MENLARHSLIARLVHHMAEEGSWCGRSHIHKTLYALQTLFPLPDLLKAEFLLYRHGMYSFELDSDLAQMEFYGALELEPQPPYGPHYRSDTAVTKFLADNYGKELEGWTQQLEFVAKRVSPLNVRELEALSTVMYLVAEAQGNAEQMDQNVQLSRARELKPHLSDNEIIEAQKRYVALRRDADGVRSAD